MFSIYDYTEELQEMFRNGSTLDSIDDFLADIAYQDVPIYNDDIINEWQETPDCWDRWSNELGETSGTILEQMSRDLYLAYRDELREYAEELYDEIEDERLAA